MARILMPILNNPAPEIRLAPESDAVMAIIPRIKVFHQRGANAIQKRKSLKVLQQLLKHRPLKSNYSKCPKAPPIGAAQMERNVKNNNPNRRIWVFSLLSYQIIKISQAASFGVPSSCIKAASPSGPGIFKIFCKIIHCIVIIFFWKSF